jgi:hypothetical protein
MFFPSKNRKGRRLNDNQDGNAKRLFNFGILHCNFGTRSWEAAYSATTVTASWMHYTMMFMDEGLENDELPLCCDRCGTDLKPGEGNFYVVHIEALAEPTPPNFSAEDLLRDPRREIERLLKQLRGLSAQEAMDQVYRQLIIYLCGPCYRQWIEHPTG